MDLCMIELREQIHADEGDAARAHQEICALKVELKRYQEQIESAQMDMQLLSHEHSLLQHTLQVGPPWSFDRFVLLFTGLTVRLMCCHENGKFVLCYLQGLRKDEEDARQGLRAVRESVLLLKGEEDLRSVKLSALHEQEQVAGCFHQICTWTRFVSLAFGALTC